MAPLGHPGTGCGDTHPRNQSGLAVAPRWPRPLGYWGKSHCSKLSCKVRDGCAWRGRAGSCLHVTCLRVVESQRCHEPVPGALLLQRVTSGSLRIQVTVKNGMVITLASVAPKRFWEAELTVPGKVQGWRLTHVLHFTQRMTCKSVRAHYLPLL